MHVQFTQAEEATGADSSSNYCPGLEVIHRVKKVLNYTCCFVSDSDGDFVVLDAEDRICVSPRNLYVADARTCEAVGNKT